MRLFCLMHEVFEVVVLVTLKCCEDEVQDLLFADPHPLVRLFGFLIFCMPRFGLIRVNRGLIQLNSLELGLSSFYNLMSVCVHVFVCVCVCVSMHACQLTVLVSYMLSYSTAEYLPSV